MAKICDGCDAKDSDSVKFYRTTIAITTEGEPPRGEQPTFDLCDKCVNRIPDMAYPNEWPRKRKARKAA